MVFYQPHMKVVSLNVNVLRAFDEKNGGDFNKYAAEINTIVSSVDTCISHTELSNLKSIKQVGLEVEKDTKIHKKLKMWNSLLEYCQG